MSVCLHSVSLHVKMQILINKQAASTIQAQVWNLDRKYGSPTCRVLAAPEMKNGQALLAPNYIYQKTMAVNDCNTQEIIILYEVRR